MNDKERKEHLEKLLGDVIDEIKVKNHVSTPICNLWVHFFDEDGEDIGHLGLPTAMDALWNDVYVWHEGGPDDPETGEPMADLDLREAVRVELQIH